MIVGDCRSGRTSISFANDGPYFPQFLGLPVHHAFAPPQCVKTFANDADRIEMFVIGRTGANLGEQIGAGSGDAFGFGYLIVKKGWWRLVRRL